MTNPLIAPSTTPAPEQPKITRSLVLSHLAVVVASKPAGFVYPEEEKDGGIACVYKNKQTGAPSCIVGHVLYRLGRFDISLVERNGNAGELRNLRDFEDDAVITLKVAQAVQDSGATWETALKAAQAASL